MLANFYFAPRELLASQRVVIRIVFARIRTSQRQLVCLLDTFIKLTILINENEIGDRSSVLASEKILARRGDSAENVLSCLCISARRYAVFS